MSRAMQQVNSYAKPLREERFYNPATPPFQDEHGVVHVFSRLDVERVLHNEERVFSREFAQMLQEPHPLFVAPWSRNWYPDKDGTPGKHTELRAIIEPWFRTTAVRAMEGQIRVAIRELIRDVIAKGTGEVDIAQELAYPLSAHVIGYLLGLDLEEVDWRTKMDAVASASSFDAFPRQWDMDAEIWKIVAKRVASNESHDQLIDVLVQAWRDNRINDEDVVAIMWMVISAATETTPTGIINMFGLVDEFGLFDYVQDNIEDERLLRRVVEEVLRFGSVFDSTITLATEPVTIGDLDVAPFTPVQAWYTAANREVDNADVFDIDRQPNNHMAFGPGHDPHVCLGAALARLELRITLQEVLQRLPGLRRDPGKPIMRTVGIANIYGNAPFRFDLEAARNS